MRSIRSVAPFLLAIAAVCAGPRAAQADAASADTVVSHAVETDPWGMGGVEVGARAVVKEGSKERDLAFDAKTFHGQGALSKSLIRFSSPADVAGMKFLQLQKATDDDERYLYAPDLKRSRRIASGTRNESFMGTSYTYADLDRRDMRGAKAVDKGEAKIGKYDCYHVEAIPRNSDAQYSKFEIWSRKDNLVPLKMVMYGKSGAVAKTFVTKEIQRVKSKWQITRSVMVDHGSGKSTEIVFEKVQPRDDIQPSLFTVKNLEKN